MDLKKRIQSKDGYVAHFTKTPFILQEKTRNLCQQHDQDPDNKEILQTLFGVCCDYVNIAPGFHCDYGFNIHFDGFCVINYNCVILDTSPVRIGNGVFIGPNVTITCAGHGVSPTQRKEGMNTSKPITIGENVWIGANCVICPGVTIGKDSIIGAGSIVTKDIPNGVIAFGNPCRVQRLITREDRLEYSEGMEKE